MVITLLVLLVSVLLFISGKIRSDVVALSSLVSLILLGILSPEEALSGFSSNIIIMMIGLFVVGGAIFKTGLAKMISRKMMMLAGNSEIKLFLLVMLVTSAIGAFVSNTGTVALMLPVVVSLALSANISPSRLLMPLAFASSMGGMMTLIGTPPNLVISSVLKDGGFGELSFFSFLPIGLICVVVGTIVLAPLSKAFLSKEEKATRKGQNGKSLKELASEYQLAMNLYRIRVKDNSILHNKKLQELGITNTYGIEVLEIRRKSQDKNLFLKTTSQKIAGPDTVIENKDILYVRGAIEKVRLFVSENDLEIMDQKETEETQPSFSGKLRFDEIGIAEVVIMSNSKLVNQKVKYSGFRERYGVNILGIQRRNLYVLQDLKDEKIQAGDVLLVQGEWKNIIQLTEEQSEWVVVGKTSEEISKITLDHKAPVAAIIMVLMVITMAFNIIPSVTAVMIAALLMVLTGCFRNVEEAYKTINWESIVLIGAMLPMSLAIEKTGGATYISDNLVGILGGYGPVIVLAGIYVGTSCLTMFISNTATAVLFAPIAMQSALELSVSPFPFLFAVAVASSMCFASPFSTPPNALVMSAGHYNFMDYVKVGLPLQILIGIVMVLVLPLLFPF